MSYRKHLMTSDEPPSELYKAVELGTDTISRQAVKDMIKNHRIDFSTEKDYRTARACVNAVPPVDPKRIRGKWILDRSGAYCCSECMEPCASYVMMKPRDKFCKMCGAKMEG